MSKVVKDIVDKLTPVQLTELDKAIEEADKKEIVTWEDFKKSLNELKQNLIPH